MTATDRPILVDTQVACLAAGVSKRTLHRRVEAGLLTPAGKDHKGRTVYNLNDVLDALPTTKSRQAQPDSGTLTRNGIPVPDDEQGRLG